MVLHALSNRATRDKRIRRSLNAPLKKLLHRAVQEFFQSLREMILLYSVSERSRKNRTSVCT